MTTSEVAAAGRIFGRLVGTHPYQLRVAQALTLDFSDGTLLIVETPLRASSPAGTWHGDPATGAAVDVLLPLLHRPVTAAQVLPDGTVRLALDGGVLDVPPHPAYEAWQLVTSRRDRVVCLPGGGLAVWESVSAPPEG